MAMGRKSSACYQGVSRALKWHGLTGLHVRYYSICPRMHICSRVCSEGSLLASLRSWAMFRWAPETNPEVRSALCCATVALQFIQAMLTFAEGIAAYVAEQPKEKQRTSSWLCMY